MERSNATGANEGLFALNLRVLQIRVLAGPVDGIVVAAEKFPLALHL
jgi:hypothetical protein